jgi:hypothetical protein
MTTLNMVGWKEGLQTVSLIEAVKDSSTCSLILAKAKVERLLAGESVVLHFESERKKEEFKRKAEALGVVFR